MTNTEPDTDDISLPLLRRVLTKGVFWLASGGLVGAFFGGLTAGGWIQDNRHAIEENSRKIQSIQEQVAREITDIRINGTQPTISIRKSIDSLANVISSLDKSVDRLSRIIDRR